MKPFLNNSVLGLRVLWTVVSLLSMII